MTGPQPVPVLAVVFGDRPEHLELEESVARQDDVFWQQFSRRWSGWQGYLNWWVARRWIIPRDRKKE